MKSIGEMLKNAREERGISIDRATHETNISSIYLEALEDENFQIFSAEAYTLGFLRIYAEFLGIEGEKAVNLYQSQKRIEEPTPIKELVGPPKGNKIRNILIIIVICGAVASAAVFFWLRSVGNIDNSIGFASVQATEPPAPRQIRPTQPLWEGTLRTNDNLVLKDDERELIFKIEHNNNKITMENETIGPFSMLVGEELYIPGENGRSKWRIHFKNADATQKEALVEIQNLTEFSPDIAQTAEITGNSPPSGLEARRSDPKIILTTNKPENFFLSLSIQGFCLLRYKIDNQKPVEAYYSDNDNIRIDVRRSLTIWASNAGSLYGKIGGEEILFGTPGQVVVWQILWVADNNQNTYNLTQVPMY